MEIEAVEDRNCWVPGKFLFNGPPMYILRLILSELQYWNSSLKGTRGMQGGTEVSGTRERAGGAAFSQTELLAEPIVTFLDISPVELAG